LYLQAVSCCLQEQYSVTGKEAPVWLSIPNTVYSKYAENTVAVGKALVTGPDAIVAQMRQLVAQQCRIHLINGVP
jgi:hypothetical protein